MKKFIVILEKLSTHLELLKMNHLHQIRQLKRQERRQKNRKYSLIQQELLEEFEGDPDEIDRYVSMKTSYSEDETVLQW